MYKNYKGYLITWKEFNIENDNLMLKTNEILLVYYCRASANKTKYLYMLCPSNISILAQIQFNFSFLM